MSGGRATTGVLMTPRAGAACPAGCTWMLSPGLPRHGPGDRRGLGARRVGPRVAQQRDSRPAARPPVWSHASFPASA